MSNASSGHPESAASWEPITAVQVIAHRVARRSVFLICAAVWSVALLVFAAAAWAGGAAVAGGTLLAVAIVIALTLAVCAMVWKRRPIPSPRHLYPMMLPHTPTMGWALLATLSIAWMVLCGFSGVAAAPPAYAFIMFVSIPTLLGSVVLVPGLVMGSRQQRLRDLLDRNASARQQLEELATAWSDPQGHRPFGVV